MKEAKKCWKESADFQAWREADVVCKGACDHFLRQLRKQFVVNGTVTRQDFRSPLR
jgi:hypothetical protein